MIKLVKTHPRHLPGMTASPYSSRFSVQQSDQTRHFDTILQQALQGVTITPAGRRQTLSPSERAFHPLFLPTSALPHTAAPYSHPLTDLPTSSGSRSVSPTRKDAQAFEALIQEASETFGVDTGLIRSVIKAESDFDPKARSRSGAIGLMQLLPSTAAELGVRDLYNPRQNILGGTRYLAMLLDRYGGNIQSALAAYNWGPGNLQKTSGRLPRETEAYIQRVLSYLDTLKA